jgi:acetylornithine deacetylase/succinyl-diaminopimelate desuccinylase-like protein
MDVCLNVRLLPREPQRNSIAHANLFFLVELNQNFSFPAKASSMDRRIFLKRTSAGVIAAASASRVQSAQNNLNLDLVRAEIKRRHDEALRRLQNWIRQASIAAENRGGAEGCDLTMALLREAGFNEVTKVSTGGQPGVFATLDAGAARTIGIYFMYDVKQVDPAEWTSPPWEPTLFEKPGLGKVLMGRGAVNQKGPQSAVLAAIHAIRGAGQKLPVNLVLVAEGEEEIGSPHFPEIIRKPEVQAALARCTGVFMPSATQGPDGVVAINLGAKGIVELELTASGERWGHGPRKDIHSSNKARVDSPAWHLVLALSSLVAAGGNQPAIEGFADNALPISPEQKAMIAEGARRMNEDQTKKLLGVERWINDASWLEALELLISKPTVNIQGLVGGYIGPGGKTILPHRAVAKLDLRLVPKMTAPDALAALKAHLAKHGFGDIEVRMTGGYDPTSTTADSAFVRAQVAVYRRSGLEPILWPRSAGSWPGFVFTGDPLRLAAGHFGLGHGGGAHAPDEFYLIESTNPKIQGYDGAIFSFADFLNELSTIG